MLKRPLRQAGRPIGCGSRLDAGAFALLGCGDVGTGGGWETRTPRAQRTPGNRCRLFALGWNPYQGNDPRPHAGMTNACMHISAMGATVFFAVGDWPVGVLFVGLFAVYLCHFFATIGVCVAERVLGPHRHGHLADVSDVRGRGDLVTRLSPAGVTRDGVRRTPGRQTRRALRRGRSRPPGGSAHTWRRGSDGRGRDREGSHIAGHGSAPGGQDVVAVKWGPLRQ